MKIGIVGCGALGGYYGGRLSQAGHSVHCLLRSDYDHVSRHGIRVTSPQGNFHFQPRSAKQPHTIGLCDLVLITLKTTANDRLPELVKPLISPHTAVICLQNGLGNLERLNEFIPQDQLLGGLCFICVNRTAPGRITHLDHGQIVLGEARDWPEPRTHDLATVFRNAGIPAKVTSTLRQAQWEKLIWNIPFNGLGVVGSLGYSFFNSNSKTLPTFRESCLTTDQLLAAPDWHKTVRQLMLEIIAVANALGYPVKEDIVERMITNTYSMKDYQPSTVIDYEVGRPLEFISMFAEPLAQAQKTDVATPILARVCGIMRRLIDENERKDSHG